MIDLKGVTRVYRFPRRSRRDEAGSPEVRALDGVDLVVDPGEFISIVGASGSGKSTLLHILGFLDRPDSGTYSFLGRNTAGFSDAELASLRNRHIGFVFQQFNLMARVPALENAALPLIYAGRGEMRERAEKCLADVGLSGRASHWPNQMSGGEQQRVAIARALVNDPIVLMADEPTGNLDSRNAHEIVALLKKLNSEGKTVIIITHERGIAEKTNRIVEMRDGRKVSDSVRSARVTVPAVYGERMDGAVRRRKGAAVADHVRQAFRALMAHKMRAALSMLGILIGVGAVIAMMAVASGARASIEEVLSSLGSNLLIVWPSSRRVQGVALESGVYTRFTMDDAKAMKTLPSVARVSPVVRGRVQAVYENKNWSTTVQGVNVEYATMRGYMPQVGRFFTEDETKMREKVAIIGTTVASEIFGTRNPLGEVVKLNRVSFRIVGVLPPKGMDRFRDMDDIVLVPVSTAMYRLLGRQYIDSVEVEVRDSSMMEPAKDEIMNLMEMRARKVMSQDDPVRIFDLTEIQDAISGTAKTMGWLLGCIAAISLMVGGIGIMNIMLVSVRERIREIGLRKAVGARDSDILFQFLVEAVILTMVGGTVGIALGVGAAFGLSLVAHWPVRVSVPSVLVALVFSAVVGLVFGMWPARQASRADPIQALRYE